VTGPTRRAAALRQPARQADPAPATARAPASARDATGLIPRGCGDHPSAGQHCRTHEIEYRRRPCGRCPWRRDTDLGEFSDTDFAKLAAANGRPGAEAPMDAPMMACHRDQPGTRHALRLCAGWLAVVGPVHLAVRLHVLAERLPAEALTAPPGWPALYADLADLLDHQLPQHQCAGRPRPQEVS
jgi:hypothetical protein